MEDKKKLAPISDSFRSAIRQHWCLYEMAPVKCACGHTFEDTDDTEDGSDPDQILIVRVDGKTFVVDCECNSLRRYEDWVVANLGWVLEFARIEANRKLEESLAFARAAKQAGVRINPNLAREFDL